MAKTIALICIIASILFSVAIALEKPQPMVLDPLPYPYNYLEPVISEETMTIHHSKHHQAYVNNYNKIIDSLWERYPNLHETLSTGNIYSLIQNGAAILPRQIRQPFINQAGGILNHNLFWNIMRAPQENNTLPRDNKLYEAIVQGWGSFEAFQESWEAVAADLFGSGWVNLLAICDPSGPGLPITVLIDPQPNQDVSRLGPTIMNLDVFEHAYYVDYRNKRGEYVKNWWQVVDWDQVLDNYYRSCGGLPPATENKDEL